MKAMTNRQNGVSLSGLLVVVVVLVLLASLGFKVIPPYIENKTIQSQFEELSRDPDLKTATLQDIRMAFIKRALVGNITAIKAEDIDIARDADGITLSASYSVKVPLAGNASLLLEFNPSSAK